MMKKPLTYIFSIYLLLMSIPAYMTWQDTVNHQKLLNAALAGNQPAIKIIKKYRFPKNLDSTLVEQALQNNPYAIQILGLDSSESSNVLLE